MKQFLSFPVRLFVEALKTCIPHMSKEETRYYLCGLCLNNDNGRLALVGTDGHTLGEYLFEDIHPEGENFSYIFPAESCKDILKMIKMHASPEMPVDIDIRGEEVTVRFDDQGVIFRLIDGEYPDYRRTIPNAEPVFKIGMMPKVLRSAIGSADKNGLEFQFTKPEEPVSVRVSGKKNITLVVMPCRV